MYHMLHSCKQCKPTMAGLIQSHVAPLAFLGDASCNQGVQITWTGLHGFWTKKTERREFSSRRSNSFWLSQARTSARQCEANVVLLVDGHPINESGPLTVIELSNLRRHPLKFVNELLDPATIAFLHPDLLVDGFQLLI